MLMIRLLLSIWLFAFLATPGIAFSRNHSTNNDTTKTACLQEAGKLLEEAFGLMKKHYYKRDSIQWDGFYNSAKAKLAAAGNCEDAYDVVSWCFRQLNETHSFIMPAAKAAVYNYDTAALQQKPSLSQLVGEIKGELAETGIAYLTVPWISTTDDAICTRIADSLQQLIARLDAQGVSKWIIDLRKNTGGNCWPMLAGIGPLLGEGVCAYFVSGNEKIPISYSNGAAMQGKHTRCQASNNGYRTKQSKKWIAVLTGPRTSSSGEIIALAFKGKEQVYLYGEPTAGLTTANATYTLSDNSMLVLTVCAEAGRDGKIYDGRITPDQLVVAGEMEYRIDYVKAAAMMWLMIQ